MVKLPATVGLHDRTASTAAAVEQCYVENISTMRKRLVSRRNTDLEDDAKFRKFLVQPLQSG